MQIQKIDTTKLHNSEHYAFIVEVDGIINRYTPTAVDIEALYPAFAACVQTEDASYNIVAKSAITREVEEADRLRDIAWTGFRTHVKSLQTHFREAMRNAAYRILVEIDAYGYVRNAGYDAETADLTNMLQALTGKLANDVATTGVGEWVTELDSLNRAFIELAGKRYDEQAGKDSFVRLRKARRDTDIAYHAIVKRVSAGIEFSGADKYAPFAADLNVRVSHLTT